MGTLGGIISTCWMFSTLEDIMSTLGGISLGGYHDTFGEIS